ncbi:hypothetical protein CSOJ01_12333 [Colletotrichum sojae]|uniref:Uncharacterized protein n=1 Tax=Colletotrichum sojae TaxID=2175907 RepID=A0A8H6MMJ3_9PEZI|nr:hypothetical protein CSOJ01_12333 [Colletotrichum sojae]
MVSFSPKWLVEQWNPDPPLPVAAATPDRSSTCASHNDADWQVRLVLGWYGLGRHRQRVVVRDLVLQLLASGFTVLCYPQAPQAPGQVGCGFPVGSPTDMVQEF